MENPNYKKLIKVLEEVFQLNQADLDFGIYRIMNYKREEILKFLHEDLIPQVKEILSDNLTGDKSSVQKKLDEAIKTVQGLGMNPDDSPKVQQLRQQLTGATDIEAEENAVFAQLANFFKRYYEGGDFISLRRYKEGVYAIPYEGEEVKLHWANHDQYYIKTSEYLKNYAFKLSNNKSVRFLLAEANTEQNNNKAASGKERRFALHTDEPIKVNGNELQIFFTYAQTDKKIKQDKLLKDAFDSLKTQIPSEFQEVLVSNEKSKTAKQPKRTLLEKHLRDYTARNTFDYFIHKNLGKFLRQELDFFIKNEVLFLDDINTRDTNDFVRQLSQVRALKSIGLKIIAFLEQLENFQKKLWLKKKFVVETQYCITLDRVPEKLYPEIIENQEQIEEWKRLFHIQEIKADENKAKKLFEENIVEYSEPLSLDFLKANPFLVLDTKFFSEDFKNRIIASIENLDRKLDGLLISSENFQALNLLQKRYREQAKCIYIDPPYNAKSSEILYKNTFKHSSWISFMANRLALGKLLLDKDGINVVAIDENEQEVLGRLISINFSEEFYNKVCVTVIHNPGGIQGDNFSYNHEFAYFIYPRGKGRKIGLEKRESEKADIRPLRDVSKGNHLRIDAANCFYPILVKDNNVIGFGDVCGDSFHPEGANVVLEDGLMEIYPIDPQGNERKWVFARQTVESIKDELSVQFNKKRKIYDIIRTKRNFNYKTVWDNKKYNANSYGSKILNNILPDGFFTFPKSVYTVQDSVDASLNNNNFGLVIDYFAGSGTTGHAIINLNREDKGERKFILVEMGEYFNSITKPRIQKVIYSKDWKDGIPISREGSSHCFKYIRLESYEDALNNLSLTMDKSQRLALEESTEFREGYMLNYMLDTEVKDSLLNISAFADPFNYYLNITRQNEMKPTKVDMVETFNYLIGLVVERMDSIRDFRVVEGKNLQEERILIIWRNTKEKDNTALNTFFERMGYSTRDQEFHRIYVNGDNNLENLRTEEDKWKVVLIEEEFKRRMFEVEDI